MKTATADVLIVGAGVIGASTAFHLTRLGAGSVTVFDRGTVGSGMSSRSSALVRMHYTFPPEVDLAVRSDAMFDSWTDLTGRPPCVRRTGFVRLVPKEEAELLRANVAMQRERGARAEVVDRAELAQLAPGMRTDDVEVAAWESRGGYGDGAIVAGDLLAAARDAGATYKPNTRVQGLATDGDRVVGVLTDEGVMHAGTVVLAAGVWSPPLLAKAGIDLPIETELHHVAVVEHPVGAGAGVACIDSMTQTYFRPEAAGRRTLIGNFTGPRGTDPDRIGTEAPAGELAELVGAAAGRVPALADAGITGGVTGVYDMTPDARPMLGEVQGRPGLVLAIGLSGMGFKISPAVGEALAELIVSGAATRVDLAAFRPGRFAEGQPIHPELSYADD
ncbi:MAG: FAD-binding oxidoreductase [Nocardiopsaceae bacterium]|jgi:glycine/D-amino acid oxidase-like deaminating enzyme|nr:FAD-binding oxidoreductase [Nocardiopsaceae bacterium]